MDVAGLCPADGFVSFRSPGDFSQPRFGLTLGAGAARDLAHIRVVRAVGDAGFDIDVVGGTSTGALVGAFVTGGLISGVWPMRQLARLQPERTLRTLPQPFAAIATDPANGREVVLDRGSLVRAAHASIALPGFLSPVRVDDRWLVDVRPVDPLPVTQARAPGADVVITVHVTADRLPGTGRRQVSPLKPARVAEMLERLLPQLAAGLR